MVPRQEVYQIHPLGWETDPEEERFKVSTLDYLSACTYNNYALFFKLDDVDKERIVSILKAGLERTLSQVRHLCGTIEKDETGGHSFVKKKDSAVQFVVQWLDLAGDHFPSYEKISNSHFCSTVLGDLSLWSVNPMTYGEKPEAHPNSSPTVAAYKANFIRGGLVFNMHHHHYANDVMGWAGLAHQLAENCYAVANQTAFPLWEPACIGFPRLMKEVAKSEEVDGPTSPERHPDHGAGVSLLFHLPKSKAAELKRLTMPNEGWISTYDAFSVFIWRTLTRINTPVFKPDMSAHLFWAEAVDMRRRIHDPKPPARIQGNVMFAALSDTAPVARPTVAEIISEWPLSKLASYVRQMTDSLRDKTAVNIRVDSYPPMSVLQTDHRDANITAANFGFATPTTYRHLFDCITQGVVIIYPPRTTFPGSDEGCEFAIFYEKALAKNLIDDPEWNEYFEYRGIDAEDAVYGRAPV
ncbi:transferase family-domain-containing protein [Aspergillus avenaceus]|uniref:Transferase family-domain-containing protein n=1 Tax=Aspergillus avenaceus TaxID=36643 RepID=A0A5N6U1M1_ASPAV|nr:transferase family-domain-containing protein [Aspergillus avenaceus]